MYIKANDWQPAPGILIEGKALEIVKCKDSMAVSAGPGAGKTELLAARANFLLSTGICPPPRRILAIAFKVDAARNLEARVKERCHPLLTRRFDSLTLDAFAKRLVDQFSEALPDQLRPSPDYAIMFPKRGDWERFQRSLLVEYPIAISYQPPKFDKIVHDGVPDPQSDILHNQELLIQSLWWKRHLASKPSRLTFDMVKSLAIEILTRQPVIRSAIRDTYSHIFLDEFQDVTARQYELIRTCFYKSDAVLTAVGDKKQAIIGWAGAFEDIFDKFEADFHAREERLELNFRSNSRIVELINNLGDSIDNEYVQTKSSRPETEIPENAIEVWEFDNQQAEGKYLASFINSELQSKQDLGPSDFVILAKIRVNDVEKRIKFEFEEQNLKLRNEARTIGDIAIQDLVKERAFLFMLDAVKLAVNIRGGQPHLNCQNIFAEVEGFDISSERGHSETMRAVRNLVEGLRKLTKGKSPSDLQGKEIVNIILSHVGRDKLQRAYREYQGGNRLNSVVTGFTLFFDECRQESASWPECISNIEGTDSVRLMTIHKSKGLEYHTVVFVEFNDDSFWGNEDDTKVFFVALSRACERVYFSYCDDSKGSKNIRPLLDRLQSADVPFKKPQ